ncbi:hypothetical protein HT585_14065 [Ensifer sp. HO-A22]|uniref:Uncharacterized protein n=1 Tax=Ensifer oleiphilus TaxID=2742698 RepID=A0A7Y6Q6I9_9HYPH|nr:hypothetical protein [Ensifer oleiphilus]NVD39987.1 hypothetical protein [Ensifer oleiphilus]
MLFELSTPGTIGRNAASGASDRNDLKNRCPDGAPDDLDANHFILVERQKEWRRLGNNPPEKRRCR